MKHRLKLMTRIKLWLKYIRIKKAIYPLKFSSCIWHEKEKIIGREKLLKMTVYEVFEYKI